MSHQERQVPAAQRRKFRPSRVGGALLVIALALGVWVSSRDEVARSVDGKFSFKERSIGEFHCAPTGHARHSAVILLHGAGFRGSADDEFQTMCAALADRGYYAEFIEYFDASDNSDPATDAMGNFRTWIGAIDSGIEALAKTPEVDPNRIAVMGFSQGAYLAVGVGALYPDRVAAIVEYYGGLLPALRDRANMMPPTLIIHGEADAIIPVSEARELDAFLTRAGRPHEMHLYPQVEHGFNFRRPMVFYNRSAADEAWKATLEFLDRTLKR